MYRGSAWALISFTRSRAVMTFTVLGMYLKKCSREKGRYRCTVSRPTFSPLAFSASTTSSMVWLMEPMATIMRSASGAP